MLADWYDPGVGGHGMGDWKMGRVYRVTPKGHTGYKVPEVDLTTAQGWLAALGSPNRATMHMANRLAMEEGVKFKFAYQVMLHAKIPSNPVLRARALWLVPHMMGTDAKFDVAGRLALHTAATDSDPRFRCQFVRLMLDQGSDVTKLLESDEWKADATALLKDESPAVRREILVGLRDADPIKAAPLILALAKQYDGKDRFYLNAVGIAVGHDPKRRDIILADFDKAFPEWNDTTADLVWELRPASMMAKLESYLGDAKIAATAKARIVDILAASDSPAAGEALLRKLAGDLAPEVRARVLENLKLYLPTKWQGLKANAEFDKTVGQLLTQEATAPSGLALIAASQKASFVAPIGELLAKTNTAPAVRKEALATLGKIHSPESLKVLAEAAKGDDAAEAMTAIAGHVPAKGDTPTAAKALKLLTDAVTDEAGKPATRHAAIAALSGTRPGTVFLIDLQGKKKLAGDDITEAGRLLRNSPFPDLRNKALLVFPAPGKIDPAKLPSIAELSKRIGNADHGRAIMQASLKSESQCLRCHTVRGSGGSIGPDLSMVGKKGSRENLLESILYPSKAIADQFIQWTVATTDGVTIGGLLVEETKDAITLRDANGKDNKIAVADIESRKKSAVSLMPDNLVASLTADDLTDLVEYLLTLKTPSLTPDSWNILGPFDNDENDSALDAAGPAEKSIDLKASYPGKGKANVTWKTVKPDGTGYLDLAAFHGNNAVNSMSYLSRTVEALADMEATFLMGNDDGAVVWVNGTKVFTNRDHVAATPEKNRIPVKLKKGPNVVLIKIVNGSNPHGLYFTVQSEEELKLAR